MRPSRTLPLISPLDWKCDPSEVAARWSVDQPLLWLHSGRLHERWARWSILATPRAVWRFDDRSRWIGDVPNTLADVRFTHDPLVDVDAILKATSLDSHPHITSDIPFHCGWIGYFSYDLGRLIEPRAQDGCRQRHAGDWPLVELAWCPDALVFDHALARWHSITECDAHSRVATRPWAGVAWDDLAIHPGSHSDPAKGAFHLGAIENEISPQRYQRMVAHTIEYIAAGDIFQANIAHRLSAAFGGSTRALAISAFESAQPWNGAYLELDDRARTHPHPSPLPPVQAAGGRGRCLLSLSPELFLDVNPRSRSVITRPIKGTRPIACDARELRDSIKDEAELNMIVDLMRNDLGRVCEFGSVRVAQPRIIETHPTVHHGVAEITGTLRNNVTFSDLLRATFPPGSVTGAPKIRAMQIIDQLEPVEHPRGPYCGAIGFISDCGAIGLNVAIRTLLLDGERVTGRCGHMQGVAHYFAGAGIVADSDPAREWQETIAKTAVIRAIAPQRASSHTDAAVLTSHPTSRAARHSPAHPAPTAAHSR